MTVALLFAYAGPCEEGLWLYVNFTTSLQAPVFAEYSAIKNPNIVVFISRGLICIKDELKAARRGNEADTPTCRACLHNGGACVLSRQRQRRKRRPARIRQPGTVCVAQYGL
jgi:hypothetical protein